jgi:hypothetical protein
MYERTGTASQMCIHFTHFEHKSQTDPFILCFLNSLHLSCKFIWRTTIIRQNTKSFINLRLYIIRCVATGFIWKFVWQHTRGCVYILSFVRTISSVQGVITDLGAKKSVYFKTATVTRAKQLENSAKTHKIYVDILRPWIYLHLNLVGGEDSRMQGLCVEDKKCCRGLNNPASHSEGSGSKSGLENQILLFSFSCAFFIILNQMAVYFYKLGCARFLTHSFHLTGD